MLLSIASLLILLSFSTISVAQSAAAVYDGGIGGNASIQLNIGNGGAGQSGLIQGETQNTCIAQGLATHWFPF